MKATNCVPVLTCLLFFFISCSISEAFDIRTWFVGLYGLRRLGVQTSLVDHFFNGLDEVKQCLQPQYEKPIPSWSDLLKMRLARFPSHYQRDIEEEERRRRQQQQQQQYMYKSNAWWTGCAVGPIRSVAAAYLLLSDGLVTFIPTALLKLGGHSKSRNMWISAFSDKRKRKRFVANARKLIGWK